MRKCAPAVQDHKSKCIFIFDNIFLRGFQSICALKSWSSTVTMGPWRGVSLSAFLKLGQEISGVSPPGNPCQRLQRRSWETESGPGGSRWHCGFGVNPASPLSQRLFARHLFFCVFSSFFFFFFTCKNGGSLEKRKTFLQTLLLSLNSIKCGGITDWMYRHTKAWT